MSVFNALRKPWLSSRKKKKTYFWIVFCSVLEPRPVWYCMFRPQRECEFIRLDTYELTVIKFDLLCICRTVGRVRGVSLTGLDRHWQVGGPWRSALLMSAGVWTERTVEGHVVSFEARSVSTAADSLPPLSVSHRRPAPRNSSVQAVNTTLTTTQGQEAALRPVCPKQGYRDQKGTPAHHRFRLCLDSVILIDAPAVKCVESMFRLVLPTDHS